jgi:2,4-dienoyl-CoA reductase-like NADH-dependent reductase (Old Yellow Enzyme family)
VVHANDFHPPFAEPNERALHCFEARARGNWTHYNGGHFVPWMTTANLSSVYESDSVVPALKMLVDAIHRHGAK